MRDALGVAAELPQAVRDLLCRFPGDLYVAGGFVRDVIAKEPFKDIDMFAIDKAALAGADAWMEEQVGPPIYRGDSSTSWEVPLGGHRESVVVQLVHSRVGAPQKI